MSELSQKHCSACEGGIAPLSVEQVHTLLVQIPGWALNESGDAISRSFPFKNFHRTMAFVNAVAWIAHQEDHHPELQVSYKECTVSYTTHAIKGLSDNDFICAAKIDAL